MSKMGIIGGSGFYNFLEENEKENVETPFGKVVFDRGMIGNHIVYFIPRHGKKHAIIPGNINYRANIFAAHLLELDYLISTNAVGSIDTGLEIGSFVIPDQIIDLTSGRQDTFFDGSDLKVTTRSGEHREGVVHTDVTNPFSDYVRDKLVKSCQTLNEAYLDGGTMCVTNGPRFETRAEVIAYKKLGATIIGMTTAPEIFLSRELEIPYASLSIVTNYASGMQEAVSAEEVFELFSNRLDVIKNVVTKAINYEFSNVCVVSSNLE